MTGRAKRVLVYTAALLIAPMPVMPYEKGTREFAIAVLACGIILALASLYVIRGELQISPRSLLGNKLLATSSITFLFSLLIIVGSIVWLAKGRG
jgi:hypothetical protein